MKRQHGDQKTLLQIPQLTCQSPLSKVSTSVTLSNRTYERIDMMQGPSKYTLRGFATLKGVTFLTLAKEGASKRTIHFDILVPFGAPFNLA